MSADSTFSMAKELGEKLKQDKKILEDNCTKDNLVAYKSNEYLFYWLKFDYYNLRLVISQIDEEAFEDGWFVWLNDSRLEISGVGFETMDERRAYGYDKYFDYFFSILFNQNRYLDEAIWCYKNGKYCASACLLFTNIEFLERQIGDFNPADKFIMSKALKQTQTSTINAFSKDYYQYFEEKMNDFLHNNCYATSTANDPEPKVINRNRVMHGILTREISKTDCLKLFVLVKSMFLFNDWLSCYRKMKEISSYLDSTQEKN